VIELHKGTNGVATVTLNRPEKHNAFDEHVIEQMTQAFRDVDTDSSIRLMVLAANGKNFSAGADLEWMKRMSGYDYDDNLKDARSLAEMLRTLNFLSKPTIAKVQGAAFGGAVGLVSCCDIAVATDTASFCLSEVKIGLIPATISPYVIAAMGQRSARRYFITAERFNAHSALNAGLVSEVCSIDELDQTVSTLSQQILSNSPAAVKASKNLVADVANATIDDELIEETSKRIANIRTSDEGQEGLSAFLEKRSPTWLKHSEEHN
jgi:methylglutaconyl-CoA hydratase